MELANRIHETFAQHVASGCSLTEAARLSGYKESACGNIGSRLSKLHTVATRIGELQGLQYQNRPADVGIRFSESRIQAIEDRWLRMRCVVEERAKDPTMQSVPGGKTGLLVKSYRSVGSGANARVVEEYRVDTPLLAELRAHEILVAEELQQRVKLTQKNTLSVSIDTPEQMKAYLASQMRQLPPGQRARLMESAPAEIAELIEPDKPAE